MTKRNVYNLIDPKDIPDCPNCGARPMYHVEPTWIKSIGENEEWRAEEGSHKYVISCPDCGKFSMFNSSDSYAEEHAKDFLLRDWTDTKIHFRGCMAEGEEESCDDADAPGCCDSCPHWGLTHCSKCGSADFTLLHIDVDDHRKNMYRCSKCGTKLRAWNC